MKTTNLKAVTSRMESACLEFKDKYSDFRSVFDETSRFIKENSGQMDMDKVIGPAEKMVRFLMNYDPSLSFLNRSPLTPKNYPYHHAINVCNIGVAVLKRFNTNFSSIINRQLSLRFSEHDDIDPSARKDAFTYYIPGAIKEIAIGYFIHDIGKALIPDTIINKSTSLTEDEQRIVHGHAHEKGIEILERNHIRSLYIRNIVRWHHAAIYEGETGGYPEVPRPIEIPPYVKICKLVDIFDAMSSKRVYGEAADSAGVVARIYRKFAGKDPLLQFILHAFISEMGVCPTGSVIHLRNGQLAFVLDKQGPIVLPLTNIKGDPLSRYADPIDIDEKKKEDSFFDIDRRKAPLPPIQAFDILPAELREMFTRISIHNELKKQTT
ncbi:hypothetical protein DSCO28_21520 [Desulfosarcina ovata subsp. sediminis]|uniref:HD-GYP domain-containing protein n=1 Tax=Desulfosarcina ovata subsp. sediminis TaxID=885957 RepID=A0A5K7ZKL7_9BACT|nr:HD domain-containing phosphohydrolase [Desulfosarcina ovata]BBO81586.1 hypothetical protein DSCO28_21520 [Desulfosarcina ovata subsp. sediminis]